MQRPWIPPPASCYLLLLFLLSLFLSFLPPSFSEEEDYHHLCRERSLPCGGRNITVPYPFDSDTGPSSCGHPDIKVSCSATDAAIPIAMGNKLYRVKEMDYPNNLLTLVDQDFVGQHCPRPSESTTLDSAFLQYADGNINATFLIGCSSLLPRLYDITCLHDSATQPDWSYYWPEGINISVDPASKCTQVQLWMSYTAVERMVNENIIYGEALQEGFTVSWKAEIWDPCWKCNKSGGVCGYDAKPICFCPDGSTKDGSCSGKTRFAKNIALGLVAGAVGFLLASAISLLLVCKKNKSKDTQNLEAVLKDHGSLVPKRYKYSDLKKITKSFHEKLGQGGYGHVFKGKLQDGRLVAVKMLSKSKENGAEFINEVASIGRTSHVNIDTLLGFCLDGHKRALVYEFMSNGSLEKYIYSDKPKTSLPWEKLYQVAIGIARGLEYLHRGCNTRIVHFDIKPHNILLDEDFCPKISDFGLAKLCPQRESIVSMADARGTVGYIAPEVFSRSFGVVSTKSDVYSYGMMVLEMVGGRRNVKACADRTSEIYFPHWVYEHLDRGGDLRAYDVMAETEEIARKMILVGLWCIQTMPANRPSMSRAAEMLEGRVSDLEMPPKPYLSSPVRSVVNSPEPSSVNSSS